MFLPIGEEGVEHSACILFLCRLGVHIPLLVAGRDEAQFHQTTRHRREAQHGEVILLGTQILASRSPAHIALHILSQFHAVLHILILNKLEHDIALRRIGIIAVIRLLIVFLQEDYRVLTLGHLQVLKHARLLTGSLTRT